MAIRVVDAPIKKFYGEDPISVTSTAISLVFRPGYSEVMLECTNAFRLAIGPKIRRVLFYDASVGSYADLTDEMLDRDTVGTGTSLDSMTTSDYLYVGLTEKFSGLYVDVQSANGNASVATWEYWNGSDWTDISDTDGTASGGATLAVDGNVTWTVPTGWVQTNVDGIGPLYWVRLKVGTALDADTEIAQLAALDVDRDATDGGYFNASTEYTMDVNTSEAGSLSMVRQSADGTLNVTWIRR